VCWCLCRPFFQFLSLDFLGYIVITIVFQATDTYYRTPWIRTRRKELEWGGKKFSLHSAPIIFKLCFADFFPVRSANPIGAGCIGAPIVLAEYKEDDCVRCASPIFIRIAY
jgi:hypothetical protein